MEKEANEQVRVNDDPLQAPVYLSRKELSSLADFDLYQTDDDINQPDDNMEDDDIDIVDDNYEKMRPALVASFPSNRLSSHSNQELKALLQLHRLQQILSSFKNRPRPYSSEGKHFFNPN